MRAAGSDLSLGCRRPPRRLTTGTYTPRWRQLFVAELRPPPTKTCAQSALQPRRVRRHLVQRTRTRVFAKVEVRSVPCFDTGDHKARWCPLRYSLSRPQTRFDLGGCFHGLDGIDRGLSAVHNTCNAAARWAFGVN